MGALIDIGSKTYTINTDITVEQITEQNPEFKKRLVGLCNFTTGDIYVAKDHEDRESTLIHEFVEAMNHEYTIGITHHWKIDRLERALYNLLVNELKVDLTPLLKEV